MFSELGLQSRLRQFLFKLTLMIVITIFTVIPAYIAFAQQYSLLIQTNSDTYKPGEVWTIRGVLRDGYPLGNVNVTLIVSDPVGSNVAYGQALTKSDGSFAYTVGIPAEKAIDGVYTVTAGASTAVAGTTFMISSATGSGDNDVSGNNNSGNGNDSRDSSNNVSNNNSDNSGNSGNNGNSGGSSGTMSNEVISTNGTAIVVPSAGGDIRSGTEVMAVTLNDTDGHWAQSNISKLVTFGAINGYPDGAFKPDNTITRAEFATVLVKAFKLEIKSGKIFADTAVHWARDYVATAEANGIVSGYDASTFGPDDLITREQMAVMIVKAARFSPAAGETQFADSGSISEWARGSVNTAVKNGVIKGYPGNTVQPQGNAIRAEAVTVIVNAMKNNF